MSGEDPTRRTAEGRERRDEVASLLRVIAGRLAQLQKRLSGLEERADGIAADLLQVVKALEEAAGSSVLRVRRSRKVPRLEGTEAALSLEMAALSDGSFAVRVDWGKQFSLSPVLAGLLEVLAMPAICGGGPAPAGWKSLDEVAILLGRKLNRKLSRHAVSQQVYRLRKEMYERGGVSPRLVETSRSRGVRFALKGSPQPLREEAGL